ncbi:uncharacterized protein LOC110008407 [Amborella trichopoda]|uniref:uncharacterized protein LOC110008407 n=1 Tax=Amborella trichopoda TaxID=13333 RepID=UPI0009BCD796|nr:uncharacterized protein LOC110008407 [Amborella trichopoda]|eukprot:XP_020531150.1 uncharacterized protein LOC110008407 [Amborella trichopoda]
MKLFLWSADKRKATEEGLKNWVGDVRELAYDALDEFITRMKILKHRRRLKHGLSFIKKFIVYHKFATEAQQIKRRVKEANDRRLASHLEAARDEGAPSNDSITHWRDPRLVFSSWRNLTSWGSTSPHFGMIQCVLMSLEIW